jgi:hypothetical protein
MTCPSLSDLAGPHAATMLAEHLAGCARCRALHARLERSEEELTVSPKAQPPAPGAEAPRAGGVWSFWAPETDEYLVGAVLSAAAVEILVVPLLPETRWATENDIELPTDTLGYPALAPVWAADHVLVEQAVEPVNMLSEKELRTLSDGYEAIYTGQALTEPAGPIVLGAEDPRIAAHAAIADELRAYFAPWSELQGSEELGPVLHARREDAGIELEEWSENLDIAPATWARFENAELDPHADIPTATIAKAIDLLKLIASERIVSLAHASVEAHHAGQAIPQDTAMARRRHRVIPRATRDPELALAAADSYAAALRKEFGL